jgi:hypothetical protein
MPCSPKLTLDAKGFSSVVVADLSKVCPKYTEYVF